jgi:crossover junction endodeoxyribonuclease RuvC
LQATVIGIDPGSWKTGWGVVSVSRGNVTAIEWGVIRQSPSASLADRLVSIHAEISRLLATFKVDSAALEGIFQSGPAKNVQSALKLAHARGVALLAVAQAGLPAEEYAPAEVKKALTGSGRADKDQVMLMVRSLLKLTSAPPEDAADALAIATCHAFRISNPFAGALR